MACHDFIKQPEKEITFRLQTDLLSLFLPVKFVLRTSEVKFAHTSPSGETSLTK